MDDRLLAERVLNDIRMMSYDEFMMKYEPDNKQAVNDLAAKKNHERMQLQLKLLKRLPRSFYEQVVTNMTKNKPFLKVAREHL